MAASREWTKIYPKDAKTLALTTSLSKLEKKQLLSLQQLKEEEIIEPIPRPTTTSKEGTPARVMQRD